MREGEDRERRTTGLLVSLVWGRWVILVLLAVLRLTTIASLLRRPTVTSLLGRSTVSSLLRVLLRSDPLVYTRCIEGLVARESRNLALRGGLKIMPRLRVMEDT